MANIVYITKGTGTVQKKCVLLKWNRSEGDSIIIGQVLFTYSRDGLKLSMSSPWSGVLLKKYFKEGETIDGDAPICIIGREDEDTSSFEQKYDPNMDNKYSMMKDGLEDHETTVTDKTNEWILEASNLIKDVGTAVDSFRRQITSLDSLDCEVTESAPFVISFAGRFKTGKSSLLNALLGMDLLPTKATTATTIVTRIIKGDELCAWFRDNDQDTPISIEDAKNIILNYEPENPENPAEMIFEVPIPWLPSYIELKDTPGTSDRLVLEQMAESAMKDTDLCICVYDAGALLGEAERKGTRNLHRQLGGNLVYAVNRTNLLNSLERVKEVEKQAKSFFGSMSYSFIEMGKFYVMCTAPGMIEMDGFDIWIKKLISPENIQFLNQLRHQATCGQIAETKRVIMDSALEYSVRIDQISENINNAHLRIIEEKKRKIKKRADDEASAIRKNINMMENVLVSITGLEDDLKKLITDNNWQANYAMKSRETVQSFFSTRFNILKKGYESARAITSTQFIADAFSTFIFPEPKFTPIRATGGEIAGGAGIGAIIGSLIAPGIGTAIGAAIGAAIGRSDNGSINNSVPNTMSYIHNTVIPTLRKSFESAAYNAAKQIQKDAEEKAKKVQSGLEGIIDQLQHSGEILQEFEKFD